ncbi:hypothetical protein N9Y42_00045 [Mariniblastus sp.]|nr:hypothetical protein [Mariniblastus sp.]
MSALRLANNVVSTSNQAIEKRTFGKWTPEANNGKVNRADD